MSARPAVPGGITHVNVVVLVKAELVHGLPPTVILGSEGDGSIKSLPVIVRVEPPERRESTLLIEKMFGAGS